MIDCEGSIDRMRRCDDAARLVTLSQNVISHYAAGGCCCWVLVLGVALGGGFGRLSFVSSVHLSLALRTFPFLIFSQSNNMVIM
jgi:hypothetical protein